MSSSALYVCQSVGLESDNVLSLGSFLTFNDRKFNSLTFIKGFETFGNDSVEVDENIATGITLDKAVAFTTIEPFDSTLFFRHDLELLSAFAKIYLGYAWVPNQRLNFFPELLFKQAI